MNEQATTILWDHIEGMITASSAANSNEWFNYLNSIAIWSGELFNELWQIERTGYILIGFAVIITTIGIAILWNQRKIKKQLKKLLDEKENKPND